MSVQFDPPSGQYHAGKMMRIFDPQYPTSNIKIWFTLGDTIPGPGVVEYKNPAPMIGGVVTVKAVCDRELSQPWMVGEATYNIITASQTIVATPNSGEYVGAQTVTINSPYVKTFYTLDGSVPTASSPHFVGPVGTVRIVVDSALRMLGECDLGQPAWMYGANYYIDNPSGTIVIDPPGGDYSNNVYVNITSPFLTTYYTTDGSMPNASSSVWDGPKRFTQSVQIAAIGSLDLGNPSKVVMANYTVHGGTTGSIPTFGSVEEAQAFIDAFMNGMTQFTNQQDFLNYMALLSQMQQDYVDVGGGVADTADMDAMMQAYLHSLALANNAQVVQPPSHIDPFIQLPPPPFVIPNGITDLTQHQLEAIYNKGIKIPLNGFGTVQTNDTKWQKNSPGTNWTGRSWISTAAPTPVLPDTDPILQLGTVGFDVITGIPKLGDGVTLWSELLEYQDYEGSTSLEIRLTTVPNFGLTTRAWERLNDTGEFVPGATYQRYDWVWYNGACWYTPTGSYQGYAGAPVEGIYWKQFTTWSDATGTGYVPNYNDQTYYGLDQVVIVDWNSWFYVKVDPSVAGTRPLDYDQFTVIKDHFAFALSEIEEGVQVQYAITEYVDQGYMEGSAWDPTEPYLYTNPVIVRDNGQFRIIAWAVAGDSYTVLGEVLFETQVDNPMAVGVTQPPYDRMWQLADTSTWIPRVMTVTEPSGDRLQDFGNYDVTTLLRWLPCLRTDPARYFEDGEGNTISLGQAVDIGYSESVLLDYTYITRAYFNGNWYPVTTTREARRVDVQGPKTYWSVAGNYTMSNPGGDSNCAYLSSPSPGNTIGAVVQVIPDYAGAFSGRYATSNWWGWWYQSDTYLLERTAEEVNSGKAILAYLGWGQPEWYDGHWVHGFWDAGMSSFHLGPIYNEHY